MASLHLPACRRMPPDCQIQRIQLLHRTPIMFYRPQEPGGGTYLQARL